jgi:hypothetical protein
VGYAEAVSLAVSAIAMPEPVNLSALPKVPACYGWLSLDRRGGWRLQDEVVTHPGFVAFLNLHYGHDEAGNWFVQNGPQRVFVALACTPWVWRLGADGDLTAHTDAAAGTADAVFVDDGGNVLLHAAPGIGLLDDRDLAGFVDDCRLADGRPVDIEALLDVMRGAGSVLWRGLPVRPIGRGELARRFGFRPEPAP